MQRVQRGEKILALTASRGSLLPTSIPAITAMLDPMHDKPIAGFQGFPDMNTACSVVRPKRVPLTISATSGGAAAPTNPWDCHIIAWPWGNPLNFVNGAPRAGNVITYNSSSFFAPLGGVTAMAGFASGAAVSCFQGSASTNVLGRATFDSAITQGVGRLLGYGIEVSDSSANLIKQGKMFCWRMPVSHFGKNSSMTGIDTNVANHSLCNFSGTQMMQPPTTIGDAMAYPGTTAWLVEKGAYMPIAYFGNGNPAFDIDYNMPLISLTDASTGVQNTAVTQFPLPSLVAGAFGGLAATPVNIASAIETHTNPYHCQGIILSGLAPNATIQIDLVYYWETFPTLAESTVLPMASPSAPYDPNFNEIIAAAFRELPIATAIGNNASGDWFDTVAKVVSQVADVVGPVAKMFPHPIAQGIGLLADGLGSGPRYNGKGNDLDGVKQKLENTNKKKKKKTKFNNTMLSNNGRVVAGKKRPIQGPLPKPS